MTKKETARLEALEMENIAKNLREKEDYEIEIVQKPKSRSLWVLQMNLRLFANYQGFLKQIQTSLQI